ncbi:MAG: hypothetical protein RPT25_07075 [Cycloclasticus sp.]
MMMLDLGNWAWLMKELVANTRADKVMPRAKVLKALLAMYLMTALYSPVRAKIAKVMRVVASAVLIIWGVMVISNSPCLRANAV